MEKREIPQPVRALVDELIAKPRILKEYSAGDNTSFMIRTRGFSMPMTGPSIQQQMEDIKTAIEEHPRAQFDPNWEIDQIEELERGDARRRFILRPFALQIILKPTDLARHINGI